MDPIMLLKSFYKTRQLLILCIRYNHDGTCQKWSARNISAWNYESKCWFEHHQRWICTEKREKIINKFFTKPGAHSNNRHEFTTTTATKITNILKSACNDAPLLAELGAPGGAIVDPVAGFKPITNLHVPTDGSVVTTWARPVKLQELQSWLLNW